MKKPDDKNNIKVSPPTAQTRTEGEKIGGDERGVAKELGGDESGGSQSQIQKLEQELNTANDNWKRALADYQNLSRRVSEDRAQYIKLANVNLLAKLVPALDIMEMAASHSDDLGVQMAAKQFSDALKSEDVQVILPAVGDLFDQSLHECIETIDLIDGQKENTISELILKGYKLGDFVLRPARVKVYKAKLALDN